MTDGGEAIAPATQRKVYFGQEKAWFDTTVIDRRAFDGTGTGVGPMILESADSTIVVPPGGRITGDAMGNLQIDLSVEPG